MPVIKIVKGSVEDVDLKGLLAEVGETKVDIVVFEWFGYCLFYEDVVSSLIAGRDKWMVRATVFGVLLYLLYKSTRYC